MKNFFVRASRGRFLAGAVALVAMAGAVWGGERQTLFSGRDFNAWRKPTGEWQLAKAVKLDAANPKQFVIDSGQGVMMNGSKARTVDLISAGEFGDVTVHVEFCIARNSNSGVYLMGRYEVQVYDSFGVEKDKYPGIECGGIPPGG